MKDITPRRVKVSGWRNRLAASRRFQRWAARFPLTRRITRNEGEQLFDLVSGFVYSQVLQALVQLDALKDIAAKPVTPDDLAKKHEIDPARMRVLLHAGVSVGLLKLKKPDRYALTQRGASLLGVPGLEALIRHHSVFYRDLQDPVALLRGDVETELSEFWPYVFEGPSALPEDVAHTYSNLMADSQGLIAEDTLRFVSLKNVKRLMDVGGGSGAFLAVAGKAYPNLQMALFDLPAVTSQAKDVLKAAKVWDRTEVIAGSFRKNDLPEGADAISLVRVLYDHEDGTVKKLLADVYAALPPGGRIIISEPMSGGQAPLRATDAYFAFYCMAMQTGQVRSSDKIAKFCENVGFIGIEKPKPFRPYVTSVVSAVKPI
ncbi:methyltransferase [Parasulfitobacter algicola]|uniref:Methyltransferase domain-containing protein n=1 Tax=Parasulfitobacter algicola TaxID=2614809 RepID=A0ABX2IS92_9RHOB|nr:methyltransferase [Sulfitobacter algicola]NSX53229.1 methyltransferase domain-containing protein [Sulfitobacter algicola]